MRRILFTILIIMVGLNTVSCSNCPSNSEPKSISQQVIDITCDSCVLFIRPSLEQIEQLISKYENEEDFYIMADDANFYTANAIEYLEDKNIDIFYLDSIKMVRFNQENILDFSHLAWDFVLYKKNTPKKIVKAIDFKYEFEHYFNVKP